LSEIRWKIIGFVSLIDYFCIICVPNNFSAYWVYFYIKNGFWITKYSDFYKFISPNYKEKNHFLEQLTITPTSISFCLKFYSKTHKSKPVLVNSTNKEKGRERKEVEIPATIRLRLQLWPHISQSHTWGKRREGSGDFGFTTLRL
jgi:hypothetical protein